eukprot:3151673-Pyramimonas_sp.AAC.2
MKTSHEKRKRFQSQRCASLEQSSLPQSIAAQPAFRHNPCRNRNLVLVQSAPQETGHRVADKVQSLTRLPPRCGALLNPCQTNLSHPSPGPSRAQADSLQLVPFDPEATPYN